MEISSGIRLCRRVDLLEVWSSPKTTEVGEAVLEVAEEVREDELYFLGKNYTSVTS